MKLRKDFKQKFNKAQERFSVKRGTSAIIEAPEQEAQAPTEQKNESCPNCDNEEGNESFNPFNPQGMFWEEFGKKDREARRERKNKLADAKAEAIRTGKRGGLGDTLGGLAKGLLGKPNAGGTEGGAPVEEKSNTALYIGIGVGAVVLIIILVLVFKKKKAA